MARAKVPAERIAAVLGAETDRRQFVKRGKGPNIEEVDFRSAKAEWRYGRCRIELKATDDERPEPDGFPIRIFLPMKEALLLAADIAKAVASAK